MTKLVQVEAEQRVKDRMVLEPSLGNPTIVHLFAGLEEA